MGRKLEASLAVLNGVLGDYLGRTGNGLGTTMALVPALGGNPLGIDRAPLAAALPKPSRRVALLAHGLMTTEAIWKMADGTDYGARLASDLGYTPIYLRYNSGLAIADNGAKLSRTLDAFVEAYRCRPHRDVRRRSFLGGFGVMSTMLARTWTSHS